MSVHSGGRLSEQRHADLYAVVRGMLVSRMAATARATVRNAARLVSRYGFAPAGARVYLTDRAGPPALAISAIAALELEPPGYVGGDLALTGTKPLAAGALRTFAEQVLAPAEAEYRWWTTRAHGAVRVHGHTLHRYAPRVAGAGRADQLQRDEAAVAAWGSALANRTAGARNGTTVAGTPPSDLFGELLASSESGWDSSTRWARGSVAGEPRTSRFVPVDLNCILHATERGLASLHGLVGNSTERAKFVAAANAREQAINEVLWVEKLGRWTDYDLETLKNNQSWDSTDPHATHYAPLWTRAWGSSSSGGGGSSSKSVRSSSAGRNTAAAAAAAAEDVDKNSTATAHVRVRAAVQSLSSAQLLQPGGFAPSTAAAAGGGRLSGACPRALLCAWDYPNAAAAPLQLQLIEGLQNAAEIAPEAGDTAQAAASRWLEGVFLAYVRHGLVLRYYDAVVPGPPAAIGEWEGGLESAGGSAWTTGAALTVADMFGRSVSVDPDDSATGKIVPIVLGAILGIAFVIVLPGIMWFSAGDAEAAKLV
jgi:neutral trehalase